MANKNNWLVGELAEIASSGAIARIDEISGTTAKCFLGSKTWIKVDTAYLRETTATGYHLPSWLAVGNYVESVGSTIKEIKRGPVVFDNGQIVNMVQLFCSMNETQAQQEPTQEPEPISVEPVEPVKPIIINTSSPSISQSAATDAYSAMAAVFAGVEQNVVKKCMDVIQPYLNKVHRTEIVIATPKGKKINKGKRVLHYQFTKVCRVIQYGIPVYLYGPAGSGKNDLVKDICEALEQKFYYLNSITTEDKLIGYMDAGGNYHETEFYRAMVHGGLLMLDEMDGSCPDTLIIINAAIANRYFTFPNGERVTAHPDFRVVAAGNTFGQGADDEYTGRAVLDASTLNRFAVVTIDYDREIEKSICGDDEEILDYCWTMRKIAKENDIKIPPVSYRTIIMMDTFRDDTEFSDEETLSMSVLKGSDKDTIRNLIRSYSGDRNNRYYKAMQKLA